MVAAVRPTGNTQIAVREDNVLVGAAHTLNYEGVDVEIVDGIANIPAPAGDLTYVHSQAIASALWTINHGLGKRPAVAVVDSTGRAVEGQIDYPSLNVVTAAFTAPFSGTAYLN